MENKLKPCKCGIKYHIKVYKNYNGLFFVMCEDCKTTTELYRTEAEAIAAWNRRSNEKTLT